MRLIVFFDLPTETSKDKKNYRLFRKFLQKEGYLMQQLSVYSKLEINDNAAKADIHRLRQNKPPSGSVQLLKVTEKQFADIEYICGSKQSEDKVDSIDDIVVI